MGAVGHGLCLHGSGYGTTQTANLTESTQMRLYSQMPQVVKAFRALKTATTALPDKLATALSDAVEEAHGGEQAWLVHVLRSAYASSRFKPCLNAALMHLFKPLLHQLWTTHIHGCLRWLWPWE